jgi:hypothetical protein
MSGGLKRSYLAVRRFVDRDVARNSRPPTLFLGFVVPVMLMAPFHGRVPVPALIAGWVVVGGAGVAWSAFVWWRAWRIMSANAIRSDREFDREGKFKLPPEYWTSESATRAARRKRARKPRRAARR